MYICTHFTNSPGLLVKSPRTLISVVMISRLYSSNERSPCECNITVATIRIYIVLEPLYGVKNYDPKNVL